MLKGVQEILNEFKDDVIKNARKNLASPNKYGYVQNTTGKLSRSLDAYVKESKNSIQISFGMEDYGWYQDLGVSGRKQVRSNTPFSYKSKMPPIADIQKWVQRKGLKGRDKKSGRFISHKSLASIIAKNIFDKGIRPTMFFTKPFEKYFKKFPQEMADKYGLELEEMLGIIFSENFKNYMK